ncbi:MAG: hypothetical protein JWO12_1651 [Frankiales bacterium]|nr:hypothetical protein [Frankiales bacterium]
MLPPRARRALIVLSLLGVALVVASVLLSVLWLQQRDTRDRTAAAQSSAVSAARQAIKNLDSLSAETVDADLARIVAGSTGSFREQFVKAQAQLKQVVVQRKTVSTATILAAGIERSDDDSATVLVAVDRSVKDTTTPQGVLAHDRWKLTMEKHGGRWLVATLDPVS